MELWQGFVSFAFGAIGGMVAYLFTRDKARENEIGRLLGRVDRMTEIVSEALATAQAAEAGRLRARDEGIEEIKREIRAVTRVQEEIKRDFAGGEHDRQWLLVHKKHAYERVLESISQVIRQATKSAVMINQGCSDEACVLYSESIERLHAASVAACLFCEEAIHDGIVNPFIVSAMTVVRPSTIDDFRSEVTKLSQLYKTVIQAARRDFGRTLRPLENQSTDADARKC